MEAWAINYQPTDIGKLIGSDGKVYATADEVPSGVTVSGMIAYVNTSEQWGLAIGPADLNFNSTEGSGKSTHNQAASACSGYDRARSKTAITGWRLPTKDDFNKMIGADGCQSADNLRQLKGRQANSCASDAAGDAIQNYGSLTGDKDADGYFRYTTKGDGTVSISLVKAPEDAWLASWTLRLDGNKLSGSDAGIAYTLQPATEAQEELISKFDAEWHGGNGEDYEWKWGHPGEDR